jgi:hypothetical protein
LSLPEIAGKFEAIAHRQITYHDISSIRFQEILRQAGVSQWLAEAVTASWQVVSIGKPTITDVVTQIEKVPPMTIEQFVQTLSVI